MRCSVWFGGYTRGRRGNDKGEGVEGGLKWIFNKLTHFANLVCPAREEGREDGL